MRVLLVSVDGLAADFFDRHASALPALASLARDGLPLRCRATAPSVTWPGHATIVSGVWPGRHGVMGNLAWDRGRGVLRQLYLERHWHGEDYLAPTLFHALRDADGVAAALSWPSARGLARLSIVDTDDIDVIRADAEPALLEAACAGAPLAALRPPDESDGLAAFVARDALLTGAARWVLGDPAVDLVALQLSSLDFALHHFGVGSGEVEHACAAVDRSLAALVEAAAPAGAAVLVTGDHGHTPVRRKAFPNEVLATAGLLGDGPHGVPGAFVVGNGGSGLLYGVGPEAGGSAARAAACLEEVGYRVVAAEAFDGGVPDRSAMGPDYLVELAPDTVIATGLAAGEPREAGMVSAHGHLPDLPAMDAQAVLWGPGVPAAAAPGGAELTDLAPTVASLLGVPFRCAGRSHLAAA